MLSQRCFSHSSLRAQAEFVHEQVLLLLVRRRCTRRACPFGCMMSVISITKLQGSIRNMRECTAVHILIAVQNCCCSITGTKSLKDACIGSTVVVVPAARYRAREPQRLRTIRTTGLVYTRYSSTLYLVGSVCHPYECMMSTNIKHVILV